MLSLVCINPLKTPDLTISLNRKIGTFSICNKFKTVCSEVYANNMSGRT